MQVLLEQFVNRFIGFGAKNSRLDDDIERRLILRQCNPVAVENLAARRLDFDLPDDILGARPVVVIPVDDLQFPQTESDGRKKDQADDDQPDVLAPVVVLWPLRPRFR